MSFAIFGWMLLTIQLLSTPSNVTMWWVVPLLLTAGSTAMFFKRFNLFFCWAPLILASLELMIFDLYSKEVTGDLWSQAGFVCTEMLYNFRMYAGGIYHEHSGY